MAAYNDKKTRGVPSKYSPELVDEIIERVSSGEPLAQVLRSRDEMPRLTTWYEWCKEIPGLSERFGRARDSGFDNIAVDTLRIADTPQLGKITKFKPEGVEVTEEDMLGHRRLQIETRLKLLAKWDPRRYGDKIAVGGADDLPAVKTENTVTLEPAEAYKRLIGG